MPLSLQVMKFGGTSVGDANCIRRAATIVQNTAAQRPVVAVVSAMSGVTNRLVKASQRAEQGEQDFISQLIADLHTQHINALESRLPTMIPVHKPPPPSARSSPNSNAYSAVRPCSANSPRAP